MKYKIKNLIKDGDIIPNIANTYPQKALKAKSPEAFYDCLEKNNCSVLCYHISRLTQEEIQAIRRTGLSFGDKSLFLEKIKNLPACCDWFKSELNNHINNLRTVQADKALCVSYGYLDLENDPACDNVFHSDWGGETIYNYFNRDDGYQNEHFRKIHNTLQSISYPCIIVVRVDIQLFRQSQFQCLYEKLQNAIIDTISDSLYIEYALPEVVEIIDLTMYEGIDFD